MKKFVLLTLSLIFCLSMLTACGGESIKGYEFTGFASEKISVGEVSDSGYSIDNKGQYNFKVVRDEDETVVMEGYFDGGDAWEEGLAAIDGGKVEVIEQGDEKLIWKAGEAYYAVFMVPGCLSYVVLEGIVADGVTDDDITAALDGIRISEVIE